MIISINYMIKNVVSKNNIIINEYTILDSEIPNNEILKLMIRNAIKQLKQWT